MLNPERALLATSEQLGHSRPSLAFTETTSGCHNQSVHFFREATEMTGAEHPPGSVFPIGSQVLMSHSPPSHKQHNPQLMFPT